MQDIALKQTELKRISSKGLLRVPLLSGWQRPRPDRAGRGRRIDRLRRSNRQQKTADDESFTGTGFIKLLKQVENDSSIQGVILRIDFPEAMRWRPTTFCTKPRTFSKKKPLVISMSDEAASGGYLCRCHRRSDHRVSEYPHGFDRRDFRAAPICTAFMTRSV